MTRDNHFGDPATIQALVDGRHRDPFAVLGLHRSGDRRVVRTLQPQASQVELVGSDGAVLAPMQRIHADGVFAADMPARKQAMRDPALWLKYVDFWSDGFATGWRQSYQIVKELYPDFWVELTHDSHNTFGAAGNDFKSSCADTSFVHDIECAFTKDWDVKAIVL